MRPHIVRLLKLNAGLILLFSLTTGLLSVHVIHFFTTDLNRLSFLLGTLVPAMIATSVLVGGFWLWTQNLNEDDLLRVGVGSVVGAILFSVGTFFTITYQQTRGVAIVGPAYIIANSASGGAVTGFIVSVYYNRQRRAQAQANQLTRQISVLNRVLRHDIRTKANLIHGYAELLTDDSSDVDTQAQKIKQQSDNVVKIGNQAKDIEQIIHKDDAKSDDIDVTSLVNSICSGLQQDYPLADISISLPEQLRVSAHPLINSALTNVIENAIEHNNKDTPQVNITSEIVSDGGTEYVELRIVDNGPGIPESEIEVLENGYETELNHSSGLGLWLVNWVITKPGGDILFQQNEPQGSIVCLRLKRANKSSLSATRLPA